MARATGTRGKKASTKGPLPRAAILNGCAASNRVLFCWRRSRATSSTSGLIPEQKGNSNLSQNHVVRCAFPSAETHFLLPRAKGTKNEHFGACCPRASRNWPVGICDFSCPKPAETAIDIINLAVCSVGGHVRALEVGRGRQAGAPSSPADRKD